MLSKILLVLFWKPSLSSPFQNKILFWSLCKVSVSVHMWGYFGISQPGMRFIMWYTFFSWCLPVHVTPFFQERHERHIKILLKWTRDLDAIILKATLNLHLAQICSVVPNIPPTVIPSDYTKRGVRWACRCNTIPLDRCQVMSAQRGAVVALCQKTC